jgi:hypothetical protein
VIHRASRSDVEVERKGKTGALNKPTMNEDGPGWVKLGKNKE